MSYRLKTSKPRLVNEPMSWHQYHEWFRNSYRSLNKHDCSKDNYETTHGVKFIYAKEGLHGVPSSYVEYLEFESEEDATMFILRWS